MNIDKINSVLVKTINHFQLSELDEAEAAIENQSVIDGDGDEAPEALSDFITKTVAGGLDQTEATDDEIIDAVFEIAEAAIANGKLLAIPDLGEAEKWTEWVAKANEAGLADATVSLIKKRAAAAAAAA